MALAGSFVTFAGQALHEQDALVIPLLRPRVGTNSRHELLERLAFGWEEDFLQLGPSDAARNQIPCGIADTEQSTRTIGA